MGQFFLFVNSNWMTPGVGAMILVSICLLFISGLVSGSEVAFFSLSPKLIKDLEEDQNKTSLAILELIRKPRELLATILILNNLINVAIILLSSLISQYIFNPADFEIFGLLIRGTAAVFFINVVFVTFLILMLGEVLPKVYANKYPVELLRITVLPLSFANEVLVFLRITPMMVKSTAIFDKQKVQAHNVTVDDLQHALDLTSSADVEKEDHKILEGVVKFGNTDVKQILIPRVKAVFLDLSMSLSEVVEVIRKTHLSRIPVFEESIDTIKGVLYAKDLLPHLDKESMDWQHMIREPFFVPENKKIDDLLIEFQNKKTHMALVVDEYGGVSGLVTLEDVIEEIVGDITDEFDDEDLTYSKLSDDCFVFEGQTSLKNMYRALGVKGTDFEDSKGEADSVAGFVLEIAGKIPVKGESIDFKNYRFTIESADQRRIKSVKVKINSIFDEG